MHAVACWVVFASVMPPPCSPAVPAHTHTNALTTHCAVRAIEDCIGISNSSGRAPIIPAHCQDRAALLEACIESQQELAKAKTGRCGGAQPIPKPKAAAPAS